MPLVLFVLLGQGAMAQSPVSEVPIGGLFTWGALNKNAHGTIVQYYLYFIMYNGRTVYRIVPYGAVTCAAACCVCGVYGRLYLIMWV